MIRAARMKKTQRGVALIIALTLVALAAILATKLTFDGWLERRRTIGIIASEQAFQFGLGADSERSNSEHRDSDYPSTNDRCDEPRPRAKRRPGQFDPALGAADSALADHPARRPRG